MKLSRVLIHSAVYENDRYPEIPSDMLSIQLQYLADAVKHHPSKPVEETYQTAPEQEFQRVCRQLEEEFNKTYAPEKGTFHHYGQLTPESSLSCFGNTHYLQLECHPITITLTKEEEAMIQHENI